MCRGRLLLDVGPSLLGAGLLLLDARPFGGQGALAFGRGTLVVGRAPCLSGGDRRFWARAVGFEDGARGPLFF